MKKLLILIGLFIGMSSSAHSQILISLLFGDKLNSDKVEFGLIGGASFSSLDGLDYEPDRLRKFSLGFYLNVKMNDHFYLHTGFTPKSTFGASGQQFFPTGDENLDTLLTGGTVQTEFHHMSLPILMSYQTSTAWGLELGPQLSYRTKVNNIFENEVGSNNTVLNDMDISDSFNRINAEAVVGLYKKLNGGEGMTLSFRYFYGLTDLINDNEGDAIRHNSFAFLVGIPIGKEKTAAPESNE